MPKRKLKLISWNVNGLRAAMNKGFLQSIEKLDADLVALQETKLQESQLTREMTAIAGYQAHFCHASTKKGYSGVATYTRIPPQSVTYGIGIPRFDGEGRVIKMEFDDFIFFNVYFPNGQMWVRTIARSG